MGITYSQETNNDYDEYSEYEYDDNVLQDTYDTDNTNDANDANEVDNTERVSIKIDQTELLKTLLRIEREKREVLEIANRKIYKTMITERKALNNKIKSLEAQIGALGITLDDAIELSINENRTYVADNDVNDTV
jgi:hypothetical protein